MQDFIYSETYKNCKINIVNDQNSESPREGDNITTMICFHSRYSLGDKHSYNTDNHNSWDDLKKEIKRDFGKCVILPLFLYDHSGLTISTGKFSCNWDSGQVGFIVIDHKTIIDNWNISKYHQIRKKGLEILEGDTQRYDDYLTGNVYGYTTEDQQGNMIDSCHGYFGDYSETDSYIMKDAKSSIDYFINYQRKEKYNKLKNLIKNKVPLIYRSKLLAV